MVFPFDLDFRDRRVFITAAYTEDSLPPVGSELLSINGIPIDTVRDRLLKLESGEKREKRLRSLKYWFRHYLWLVFQLYE